MRGGTVPMFARVTAGVKPAMPFPAIGAGRIARPFGDGADMNGGIVDVPSLGVVVDAMGHVDSIIEQIADYLSGIVSGITPAPFEARRIAPRVAPWPGANRGNSDAK